MKQHSALIDENWDIVPLQEATMLVVSSHDDNGKLVTKDVYEFSDSASYKEMNDALIKGDMKNMMREVVNEAKPKKTREFFENADESWPPPITGFEKVAPIIPVPFQSSLDPDGKINIHWSGDNRLSNLSIPPPFGIQGHPDVSNIEQLPVEKVNWYGLAARTDAEPPMYNYEGWQGYKRIPPDVPLEDQAQLSKKIQPTIFKDLLPKQVGMDMQLPPMFRETIQSLKNEFNWLTPEYIGKLKELAGDGSWLLIRASSEAITDHRKEGELYPRWLQATELERMTRTAIGHGADINHLGENFRTSAYVTDAEFDENLKQMQLLVFESDPEVLQAIANKTIQAVSINGSPPRIKTIEPCDVGTCEVPHGVVLGQDDDIAFTYVVTHPAGMQWRGQLLPMAEPGVKNTKIEIL